MQAAVEEINREMGAGKAADMEIQWFFNPPAAPHFGGAWERLIQIIKKCLYVMIKEKVKGSPRPEQTEREK